MSIAVNTGFAEAERTSIAEALSKVLADTYALYLKTHGYHWNVTGPTFQALHTLFEGQYSEQWQALDDIAERIRALGELVPQTYSAFANLTAIKDGHASLDSDAMVAELLLDNETVVKAIRGAFAVAESASDEATMDMLNARTAAHEKHAWMLRATLDVK
ncbi:Dps family protein [Bradyrhizobium sp. 2S1]|uniref:Dps family protein n=1 Tax=Bradyrhizobium sp. 2S1 TaxID=1404429 RepID=UPI001409CBBD|nr:Dps family protein [Bradyrhizobium sp. 2S1]MCK7669602.1 DNA starvation/stationary phase protection protein [Bradyrhizobium sp. 2S1]